jgi:Lipocalin-like domain
MIDAMQLRERLLGSWRIVSWTWRNASGDVSSPLGDDPAGLLTYDASGTVSAQLMRRSQPRFKSDDWLRATADEEAAAWSGYFGYFGTYSISESADAVIHHVEGSSFPNLVGTEQVRYCHLAGNRLSLDAETAWGRVGIVWEKVGTT